MKVRSNKEQQRQQLRRQTERYLASGGRIRHVADGASGRDRGTTGPRPFAGQAPATRTDLSALAATIDARKRKPATRPVKKPARRRRKLIYDDFGEPLRWVWEDSH